MDIRDSILGILQQELGPAAPIFLEKCCKNTLSKKSSEIEPDDLVVLSECFYSGIRATLGEGIASSVREKIREIGV